MASENPEPPSPPNNREATNQSSKKRSQTQKRLTAAQKERDRRRAMIEQCHVQSQFGLDIILQDGITKTTFTNYIGEHQSQIFYGGFDIQRPNRSNIHIALGQPTPIDLGNSDSGPAVCLAVPTYIFCRFPSSEKPISSATSDLNNLPSPLSGVSPSCTSKNGLCLVTFKIYFPVHFMASANKISSRVRCGKEANLRYTPRFNEFVEYYNEPRKNASISKLNQNRLSMEVNEFVRRVLLSHQNLSHLKEHSMKLPDFSVFSKTEIDTAESTYNYAPSSPDIIPTFLVLPLRTYMRIAALKNRLDLGWKSLPPCHMGNPMRLTKTTSAQKDPTENTMTWAEWTGVKDALTLPPDVVSKIINCDKSLEVRIVFIRRTSGDCGKAISQVIQECQLEPARIRRTNSKDSEDYKFLKVKQLVLTDKVKEFFIADADTIPRKSLKFQEVWSRDIDSNPYIMNLNAKALSSIRSVKPTINELFGDLGTKKTTVNGDANITTPNTTNNNAPRRNGVGEQLPEPQLYQRPSRLHVPPQRLQMADTDLLRAIHKRTHSDAELLRLCQQAIGPEVEHNHSNGRHRPSSPSATSDSALSTKISRKSGVKRKQSYEQSSDNKTSTKRRKVEEQKLLTKGTITTAPKCGDSKAKSGLSSWAYAKQRQSIKITSKMPNSNPITLEANDPYALPSSPIDANNNIGLSQNHSLSLPSKKAERSPSPEPPVLVPEGKLDDGSFERLGDGNRNDCDSEANKKKQEEKMNGEGIPSPVLDNHRNNEACDDTTSSPPTLSRYSSSTEQSITNGGKAHLTYLNSQPVSNCPSNGLPPYALSRSSTLQPNLIQSTQPPLPAKFPSQPPAVSSSLSFQMPVDAPQVANSSINSNDSPGQRQSAAVHNPNTPFQPPHSLWNGVLYHSGGSSSSQPATMWTLRETPLPAPDNNSSVTESIPHLFTPTVAFPMTFLSPGSIVPIPTPTPLITPTIALTTQSPQLTSTLNTASLTPEMATFLNYYASFISAAGLLNPGQSPNNDQSPITLHSESFSMPLPPPPTVANTRPWNSSNQQRGGLL
ncbi:unnamed protein product [Rodentolepis nana]|uniref:NARG2_C domain-containing protein n=1 Tax=Rodentolepis nana TaxID=102285 RepID=A0A0R3T098_RODNA|nr:unnamed protein product [Rodentolepis nana]